MFDADFAGHPFYSIVLICAVIFGLLPYNRFLLVILTQMEGEALQHFQVRRPVNRCWPFEDKNYVQVCRDYDLLSIKHHLKVFWRYNWLKKNLFLYLFIRRNPNYFKKYNGSTRSFARCWIMYQWALFHLNWICSNYILTFRNIFLRFGLFFDHGIERSIWWELQLKVEPCHVVASVKF